MKITTPQRPSTVGYVKDFLPNAADYADYPSSAGASLTGHRPLITSRSSASAAPSKDGRRRGDSRPSGQEGLSSLPKGIGAQSNLACTQKIRVLALLVVPLPLRPHDCN